MNIFNSIALSLTFATPPSIHPSYFLSSSSFGSTFLPKNPYPFSISSSKPQANTSLRRCVYSSLEPKQQDLPGSHRRKSDDSSSSSLSSSSSSSSSSSLDHHGLSFSRRAFFKTTLLAPLASLFMNPQLIANNASDKSNSLFPASLAETTNATATKTYKEVPKYTFTYPSNWTAQTTVIAGGRSLVVLFPENKNPAEINVTVLETGISGDFQKITSFGDINKVASTIVPSQLKGPAGSGGQIFEAKQTRSDAYFFDYALRPKSTVAVTDAQSQQIKHLLTLFTLKPGQWIFTVTAQCSEGEQFQQYKGDFMAILDSFKVLKNDD